MAPKTDYATQLKELKDLIETTNTNIKLLENRITTNHKELMARICNVETQAREALDLAKKKNETTINEFLEKQQETNDDLKLDLSKRVTTQVKENLHINKIEAQLRGVLLELEDLRNRSMRSNLIFKGIPEESKETWDDTSQLLAGFITKNLKLPYSFDQMDMQISRAHRSSDTDSSRRNNKSEPRPIISVCKLESCRRSSAGNHTSQFKKSIKSHCQPNAFQGTYQAQKQCTDKKKRIPMIAS